MPAPSIATGDAGGTLGGDTIKTVFYEASLAAFRAQFVYRQCADVKWAGGPGAEPQPGNAVTFTVISALAPVTAAIAEATEPAAVQISDTQKTVTLLEQGSSVKTTKKFRLTSFMDWDLAIPREVAANMEESLDIIARDVLAGGTNVYYQSTAVSRVTVGTAMSMTAGGVRRARAKLSGFNTPPPPGSTFYIGFIHPDVSFDVQQEVGNQAWTAPHVYADTNAIYTGELGAFSGVRIVENANAPVFDDAGVGAATTVYATIFVGQQALGEGVGEAQHMVLSGPFDDLQRFLNVGWYALIGYGRIRENSLVRVESSSSIGDNA
jgi:N4-gp56 family major capsid protein